MVGGVDSLVISEPQASDLTAQVAKAVASADFDFAPGAAIEELDLLVIRGCGDEVFVHGEAGGEVVVFPVAIGVELHVWVTHAVGVEGKRGAEVVGYELKYGWRLGKTNEDTEKSWRTYVVLHACHDYSLISQFLGMIDCGWKLEPQAHSVISYVPQADGPASLSS